MLQTLKVESSKTALAQREPEPAQESTDAQDPLFGGLLMRMVAGAQLPQHLKAAPPEPAPAPAPERVQEAPARGEAPRKEAAPPRRDAEAPRDVERREGPRKEDTEVRATRERAPERTEAGKDAAGAAPGREAGDGSAREGASGTADEARTAGAEAPAKQQAAGAAEAPSGTPEAAPAAGSAKAAQIQPETELKGAQGGQATFKAAAAPQNAAQLLPSGAAPNSAAGQTASAGQGLKLQFQYQAPSKGVEQAPWSELLYTPRVEMQVPRHLADLKAEPQAGQAQGNGNPNGTSSSSGNSTNATPGSASAAQPAAGQGETSGQGAQAQAQAQSQMSSQGRALPARGEAQTFSLPSAEGGLLPAGAAAPGALGGGVARSSPATSTPSLVMPQGTPLFSQVEGSVKWMLRNGSSTAELQLSPESLGKVLVQLKVERGEVHARLVAAEPGTLPLLQEHKAILEASLREQGLNLASFDLRQGNRGEERDARETPRPTGDRIVPLGSSTQQEMPIQNATEIAPTHRLEVIA